MDGLYLYGMLAVILVMAVVGVRTLFHKKCPKCKARNALDARECGRCREPFPEEGAD